MLLYTTTTEERKRLGRPSIAVRLVRSAVHRKNEGEENCCSLLQNKDVATTLTQKLSCAKTIRDAVTHDGSLSQYIHQSTSLRGGSIMRLGQQGMTASPRAENAFLVPGCPPAIASADVRSRLLEDSKIIPDSFVAVCVMEGYASAERP